MAVVAGLENAAWVLVFFAFLALGAAKRSWRLKRGIGGPLNFGAGRAEWRNAVSDVYREQPRVLQMVLFGAGLFVTGFAALGFGRLLSGSDAIKIVFCVIQLWG